MNNPNIDLSKSTEVKCEKCESQYFVEAMMIRKLSKFVTGETQDSIIPIPVIKCADCGYVNEEFKPKI